MRRLFSFCLVVCALLIPCGMAQDPLSVRVESFVVSEVDGQERLTQATTARPGQVIEYRLFARNEDETTLPAGTVVITVPVNEGTRFIANSATPTSERVLTEYSVDSETFGEPPLIVESDAGERTVAEPARYTALRWTLLEPLEPGAEETFSYRVTMGDD